MNDTPQQPSDNSDEQKPTPHSPKLPPNAPVSHGFISDDFPCYQCAYNLRTTHIDASCPECGFSILNSLVLGSSFYNHIPWLKKISSGLMLMIIAVCITIGIYLISFIPTILIKLAANNPQANIDFTDSLGCLVIPAAIAIYILFLLGIIQYTTKQKSTPKQIAQLPSRHYLRFTYIFWAVASILAPFVIILPTILIFIYIANSNNAPDDAVAIIFITMFIISVICITALPCIIIALFLRYTSPIANYFQRSKVRLTCSILYYATLAIFSIPLISTIFTLALSAFDFIYNPTSYLDTFPDEVSTLTTIFAIISITARYGVIPLSTKDGIIT